MSGAASARVRAVLDDAVAVGLTPGGAASIAIGTNGPRLDVRAGRLFFDDDAPPVDAETVYDLASVTKLLSTTMLAARAVAEGRVRLDETPWPAWPDVTPAHALAHTAGVPAWLPLYEAAIQAKVVGLADGARCVVAGALAAPVEAAPGTRTLYSDLGMIALGALLEERFGRPLDAVFDETAQTLFGPTGLRFVRIAGVGYHPAIPRVAPTARCPWRGRVVVGQVHDDNCFSMGGVSGHAGLFGALDDVTQAARGLLGALQGGGGALGAALRTFAAAPGERGLGFDRATPGGSTGDALSPLTVGHLGFTGTSSWIDPAAAGGRGAVFVLLTNYVHKGVDRAAMRDLRRAFHAAAADWVSEVDR